MKACHLPPGRSDSGYIMLEVMLASFIFTLVAVALARALNGAVDSALEMQRESKIVWNLESKLAEAKVNRLVVGKQTLVSDEDGVSYEEETSPLDLRNQQNQFLGNLYDLKITAHWKDRGREEERSAQTYVYQP